MQGRALIAHYFPGEGPPFDLTLDEFNGLIAQIEYIIRLENGTPMTDREQVEQTMKERDHATR